MKKPAQTRSRSGRPKKGSEAARREAILDAAMAEFAARGYGATTLDAIAKRARTAKRTLYEAFGGKEKLFQAAVARVSGNATAPLTPPQDGETPPLRDMLTQAAYIAISTVYTAEKAAIYRMVVGEAPAFPELAANFYNAGAGAAITKLTVVLRKAMARGEIARCDPEAEAKRLVGFFLGEAHLRLVLGLDPAPTKAQARKRAEGIVDFFLRALAPR
jgi:AcrR family transcriptional regulator